MKTGCVKIKADFGGGNDFAYIDEKDFDAAKHELHVEKPKKVKAAPPAPAPEEVEETDIEEVEVEDVEVEEIAAPERKKKPKKGRLGLT